MKRIKIVCSGLLILSLVFSIFVSKAPISLADSYDIKVTQTSAKANSVEFKWSYSYSAVDIYIDNKAVKKNYKKSTYTYKKSGMSAGKRYNVVIVPTGASVTDGSVYVVRTKPTAVKTAKATFNAENDITTINWISDYLTFDGYQIKVYNHKSKCVKTEEITESNIGSLDVSLSKNAFFKVRVRGYILVSNKKVYGAWSGYRYIANMPSTKFVKSSNATIKVSWKKVTGASQYVIYVGRYANGQDAQKTATVKASKTSYNLKKIGNKSIIKDGMAYYVFLKPCIKVGKKQKVSDVEATSDPILFYTFDE